MSDFNIVSKGDIGIVEFDSAGEKVNVLGSRTMTNLRQVISDLKSSSYKIVLFTSKKNKSFIVGADIGEIKDFTTAEQFDKAVAQGQEIFNMIEDLPMPTMAVVNGVCVGGGCEFIMACDYRVAADDASVKIGLPEIKLGIIPGFGGCVRMPRMIGLQAALGIILEGKTPEAKKVKKLGLIDKVVHPDSLMDFSMKWAGDLVAEGAKKRRKKFKASGIGALLESFAGRPIVFSKAKSAVLAATHGHYPAPLQALDVIKKTYGMSRDKALQLEREGFCKVAVTSVSKSLVHVFYLTEMVKKQTGVHGSVEAKSVSHMGVLGAGTMGGGIAYVAADKGIEVRMKDVNFEAVGKGLKHARELWQKLVKRGALTSYDLQQRMSLVSGGTDYSGFKNIDVVVEAIVEDMEIKKKVIAQTAREMRPDAIIATNTSSLSVTEMAEGHPNPAQFAGMHFFNPVNKMPLVEVIRGAKSSDQTVATIFSLAKKMGKMPVVVKDGPGFLVNRLLLPYMAEAAFLLQEGMSIETLDTAFVKEFGMPMGPCALMDEVGLDVCIKVLKIFKKAFGSRVEMAPLMEKLEKSGRLGKKNGRGFYTYDSRGYRQSVAMSIYSELGLSAPSNKLPIKECLERGVFAMINECALALVDDKIVETPHEVDLAMIMGTGFPPFRGGLLKYADSLGSNYIADQLEVYAAKGASRLAPSAPLRAMAKDGRKFYN